jgi:hypothetical protein
MEDNDLHDPSCKHHSDNVDHGDDSIPDEDSDDSDDESGTTDEGFDDPIGEGMDYEDNLDAY